MESFGLLSLSFTITIIAFILSIIFRLITKPKQNNNLPPSPIPILILGHLHYLLKQQPHHRALETLSRKLGPVIHLRLGSRPVIVISSPSAAEECCTKNDIIFANRPESLVGEHLGYGYSTLGFSPYGGHWRHLRRVATTHIFSSASVHRFSAVRAEEVRFQIRKLVALGKRGELVRVNLNELFLDLVFSVMMRMVAGKRWSESVEMFGPPTVMSLCDYIPILRWIDFQGTEKKLIKLKKQRDIFLQALIDEARNQKIDSDLITPRKKETIIESLLSLQQGSEPGSYRDEIIKGVIMVMLEYRDEVMFTAGIHGTAQTMEWAMATLLNRPYLLEKARDEINSVVGSSRVLEDSDLPKLTYLNYIVNETLRLYPSGPLLVPHFSSQNCTVAGYEVPRGTTLIVNAWAIHRDPNVWDNPGRFEPERWARESEFGFRFLPFGMGRRACPGSGLAVRLVSLVLGTFIQCFEWERVGPGLVDLEEGSGLSMQMVKPLEAMCMPRQSLAPLLSQL